MSNYFYTIMASTSTSSPSTSTSDVVTGYLKGVIGQCVGKIYPLKGSTAKIGRNQDCAIKIADNNVSRNHCTLKYENNKWFVTDDKSINGTYIDGVRIVTQVPHVLKEGFVIYLGPAQEACAGFVFLKHVGLNGADEETAPEQEHPPLPGASNSTDKRKCNCPETESTKRPRILLASTSTSPEAANLSCSSQDDLQTRVQKNLASKKKKKCRTAFTHRKKHGSPRSAGPSTAPENGALILNAAKKLEFQVLDTLVQSQDLVGKGDVQCDPFVPEPASTGPRRKKLFVYSTDSEEDSNSQFTAVQDAEEQINDLCERVKQMSKCIKDVKARELAVEEKFNTLKKLLEEELSCTICTEVLIKTVTLNCAHSFCEHCINKWKKKQKKCPICRESISSEKNVLILDSFIEKAVELAGDPFIKRRKKEIRERNREKGQAEKLKKKKAVQRRRNILQASRDNNVQTVDDIVILNSEPVAYVEDVSDLLSSSESDYSLDGSGYYGGYGRCYNCGRRGHWANGCPLLPS